ncbi:glycosyltransferase [Geoalkalibacter subterraneus]|uniref:Glycosyl transferase family 1 n=1 Tax=Geoalkalibacter subterraneus TaxID=483547 RepID=A0A0B5FSA8_9BACT|nr:glycosyltransferase [Geoalkalibacter subterraneus]AJF06491.1 hypothetical protein GSUB_07950 [Geoalkalibacter subterraneus]
MKILYICHRIPYPPNKGDKIRSFNEVKYLAENHDLYLAFLVDDPADVKNVDPLRKYCVDLAWEEVDPRQQKIKAAPHMLLGKPLSLPYFYSSSLQRKIDQWAGAVDFDAVVCFSGPMAEYVFKSNTLKRESGKAPRLVMDFCDVDSDKWGQFSREGKFPMNIVYGLEQKRLLAYEAKVNREFDCSILVTENEAHLFKTLVPEARNVEVVGNGVDFKFFNPEAVPGNTVDTTIDGPTSASPQTGDHRDDAPRTEPMHLVFTGAMDYHANVDAVTWFCRDILPIIRESGIDVEFYIVGGRPTPAVKALEQVPGVTVTGFVDDIRTWYAQADVCVLPMRLGRGVQNKVLEAMAMQRPVVTTTKAAEGVSAKDLQHLLVADSPEDIARSVIELCKNPNARTQLGEAGRTFVTENFDWKRNMEKLEELLK